jgi:trimeric autotransporter adhesin
MSPATAVFVNTSCAPGGTIVLGNVLQNDNYTFDVEDDNGCVVTVSGTMAGSGVVDLSYPKHNYCKDELNPTATIVGAGGGTYSSVPAGLSINAATGAITLIASTSGSYVVTYQAPGATCPPSDTFSINVFDLPIVNAGVDQGICQGSQVTLSGVGAPTLTWNNGVLNGVAFSPGITTTYTLTGENAAGCMDTDDVTVTVENSPVPSFTADKTIGCVPLTVTLTNTGLGTGCVWTFGDGTVINGCGPIVHTFTQVGCYSVSLQTESALGCEGTTTINDYICVAPDPIASFAPTPSSVSELNPVSVMNNTSTNAVSYQWSFEDGGSSTEDSPEHTFNSTPGTYEILLIATSQFGCIDSATALVTVVEELIFYVPNTFTPDGDEYNNSFKPVFTSGFDPMDYNLIIFNRWGEILFESNNSEVGWDGTYLAEMVKDGVYVWKIEFKTSRNDARRTEVGHVTMLR